MESNKMDKINDLLLMWDESCVSRMLGLQLSDHSSAHIGPEGIMLHVLIEYFTSYVLSEASKSDDRFAVQDMARHGNMYEGVCVDKPCEFQYLVTFKKLNPEVCFFEDVSLDQSGANSVRITDKNVLKEWSDVVIPGGFLHAQHLLNQFASCVKKFAKDLSRASLYPCQMTGLLPQNDLPCITECTQKEGHVELNVTFPCLGKLSTNMKSVTICIIPSIKFPGWPSSTNIPERIPLSNPLHNTFMDESSNGFYVTPPLSLHHQTTDGCFWHVSTNLVSTHVITRSSVPLAGYSCLRMILILLGRCESMKSDHMLQHISNQIMSSSVSMSMLKTALLLEIEQNPDQARWSANELIKRVLSVINKLEIACQCSSLNDYYFPGLSHLPQSDSKRLVQKESCRSVDIQDLFTDELINDSETLNHVADRHCMMDDVRYDEDALQFIECPSVNNFPSNSKMEHKWKLLAESTIFAHHIYELQPRENIIIYALELPKDSLAYTLIMLCELFRQYQLNDPNPSETLQKVIQEVKCNENNVSPQDIDLIFNTAAIAGHQNAIVVQPSTDHILYTNQGLGETNIDRAIGSAMDVHTVHGDGCCNSCYNNGCADEDGCCQFSSCPCFPCCDKYSDRCCSCEDGGCCSCGDDGCCSCGDDGCCSCGDDGCFDVGDRDYDCDCDCVIM
ncbi:uncharacterized protein LOC144362075 [Saccoglossus kowalevskii]